MVNTSVFNIFFAEDGASSNVSVPKNEGMPNMENPVAPKGGGAKGLVALATIQQIGKTSVQTAASHVELFTGSADAQDKVNTVSQLMGTGLAIAANPALGIAMAALNVATKALNYSFKKKWDDIATEQAQQRLGPSFNRSRLRTYR